MDDRIKKLTVDSSESILSAMKQMDSIHHKLLIVTKGGKFYSMVSIGDVQRAIIKGVSINGQLNDILRENNITIASDKDDIGTIKSLMREKRIEFMPIIGENAEIKDIIFWRDLFEDKEDSDRPKIHLPVVIMAGGKGTRLKPLTNVIPKPLIPVGDRAIIQEIMDQFESIGCSKFYISVNYKVEMMKFYLSQLEHHYDVEFFQEDKPLGTIGSVSLLRGRIKTPFIVSNCDIVIDQDYRDVYDYHIQNGNDITLVAAVKTLRIPYGVVETGGDGLLLELKEKPENTFMFNTGVYILNPDLIDDIPVNSVYHITDLMEQVKSRGGRVGCFPVSDKAWHDMGEWSEYLKLIRVL